MPTDCAVIDRLMRELRSDLRSLRLLGEAHRESVLRILRELDERPTEERAVYAFMLLQTLHGWRSGGGDGEISAGLARVLSGAGDEVLAAAASQWLAGLGSPGSSLVRQFAAELAGLAAAHPALHAVAVGGGEPEVQSEHDARASDAPAPRVARAHDYGPYVDAAVAVLAEHAGMELSAYRAVVRARVEELLGAQAAAGRMRIVPYTEHGEVVLRAVVVVRVEVVDPARELSLAALRAAGLDAHPGATVSLRVWVRRDPGGVKAVSDAFDAAVFASTRHAPGEPEPTPIERVGAAHAPPGLALAPFHAMSLLHVVEVEHDPSREITRERLAAELEIFDEVEIGAELRVFDPAESVAVLGAAARALWADEAIVHLDGWWVHRDGSILPT